MFMVLSQKVVLLRLCVCELQYWFALLTDTRGSVEVKTKKSVDINFSIVWKENYQALFCFVLQVNFIVV
jgi:hypothetical protein